MLRIGSEVRYSSIIGEPPEEQIYTIKDIGFWKVKNLWHGLKVSQVV